MKFKRQSSKENVDVNLTPLIDVVFLLLIFFMVSTSFTRESQLKIDLPESSGEASAPEVDQIEIVISAQGEYAINQRVLVNNQKETLRRGVLDVAPEKRNIPFIITADAQTPHEYVVQAMDVAGQLGFARLSITTRRATGSP